MSDEFVKLLRNPAFGADALTRRLADTAIEHSELYQAAKRDAEEAEAYAAELEAALATARRDALNEAVEAAWEADSLELSMHGVRIIIDRIRALAAREGEG